MTVAAIRPGYVGERRDRLENFHGNQIVYVAWDRHLMFCSPVAFALPPDTPFSKLQDEILPGAFSQHPDFSRIEWGAVQWHLNNQAFVPERDKSLIEQGVDHKSIIRMATPGLDGIKGSGS
ncbi:MAG: phenol hydroxylase subunit P4 [Halieaceae bacterium]|jgi:phenol hydroxylase P4 protein|nr:phenol hydroxylase subunit P4 [Halieaceae bacterium]